MNFVQIIIGFIILFVIMACYYAITSYLRKNSQPKREALQNDVDIDLLIQALGGEDNIQASDHSHSKLMVTLYDNHLMDVDKIKELGASGIVENKKSVSMIFGKTSQLIDEDLKKELDLED